MWGVEFVVYDKFGEVGLLFWFVFCVGCLRIRVSVCDKELRVCC